MGAVVFIPPETSHLADFCLRARFRLPFCNRGRLSTSPRRCGHTVVTEL